MSEDRLLSKILQFFDIEMEDIKMLPEHERGGKGNTVYWILYKLKLEAPKYEF